jgi:hypothetical protein
MNQRYTDKRLSELGGRRAGMDRRSLRRIPIEPSETVIREMNRQFQRFVGHVNSFREPDWNITFEEFADLWRPHWSDRRRLNLVICRIDHLKPYESGNVYIDTRSNQVKQQWKNYRDRINQRDLLDEV